MEVGVTDEGNDCLMMVSNTSIMGFFRHVQTMDTRLLQLLPHNLGTRLFLSSITPLRGR